MRAGAIALVLFSHTTIWFFRCGTCIRAGVIGAYLGVELFFVLSGFLIGGILLRSLTVSPTTTTALSFWRRRWVRTLPNYFLFLVLNVALSIWATGRCPPFFSYLFFCQNLFGPSPEFFSESWSLAIEEWFYLLLPLLFLGAREVAPRRFASATLTVVVGVIILATALRTAFVLAVHPAWLRGVRVIVLYRLDACMFGVLAAWVKHFQPRLWARGSGALCCLGLALLGFISSLAYALPATSIVLHTIGFDGTSLGGAFLLPFLDQWSIAPRWGRPIIKLSLWSYSLYLVNMPIHEVLTRLLPAAGASACAILFVGLSLVVARINYRLFEKPIMDLRDDWPSKRRRCHPLGEQPTGAVPRTGLHRRSAALTSATEWRI